MSGVWWFGRLLSAAVFGSLVCVAFAGVLWWCTCGLLSLVSCFEFLCCYCALLFCLLTCLGFGCQCDVSLVVVLVGASDCVLYGWFA